MKKVLMLLVVICCAIGVKAQSSNFREGKSAYDEEEYDKAMTLFNKDIGDNPKSPLSYRYRAGIYYKKRQYANALSDVNRCLSYTPRKEKENKSELYRLRGKIYGKLDEMDNAIRDYTLAIKTYPKNIEACMDRAQIYYDKKMYSKAEADYLLILKMDESDEQALAGMGRNYIAMKNYEEANKVLLKLTRLHPGYSTGYYYRAKSLIGQGKYRAAIDQAFNALRYDNEDVDNSNLFLETAEKDYPYALSLLSGKVRENPDNYFWSYYKGLLQYRNEDYAGAAKVFTRLIALKDDDVEAYSQRGRCYAYGGQIEKSIADLDRSLKGDSTLSDDYAIRARCKRILGKFDEAIKDLNQAIELEPSESWIYFQRGMVYDFSLGRPAAALSDYSKAIELDNKTYYSYLQRGRLYKNKLNDAKKADVDFEYILKEDTALNSSGNCRQFALLHLGRIGEAVEWMNKILAEYPGRENYYDAACFYSLMNKKEEALKYITYAFECGERSFSHISLDPDLDNVRNDSAFKAAVEKWRTIGEREEKEAVVDMQVSVSADTIPQQTMVIPIHKQRGGTYEVSCKINSLPLNFIFDTGASDISISQTEVQFMLKNKYLNRSDIRGQQSYVNADGDVSIGTKILLRKVEIGSLVLNNVEASVVNNSRAPLLFGQSALGKYARIVIDNKNNTISISNR